MYQWHSANKYSMLSYLSLQFALSAWLIKLWNRLVIKSLRNFKLTSRDHGSLKDNKCMCNWSKFMAMFEWRYLNEHKAALMEIEIFQKLIFLFWHHIAIKPRCYFPENNWKHRKHVLSARKKLFGSKLFTSEHRITWSDPIESCAELFICCK